jgi:class 3 adenylate cyclase
MGDGLSMPPHAQHSASEWVAMVKAAERDGEFFRAYDAARQGLSEHPDDLLLRHRAVLALARSGATEQAQTLYRKFGLEGRKETDIPELEARLLKDVALAAADGPSRGKLLLAAAKRYEAVYRRSGHYYPGINVANLLLLAGQPERSAAIARRIAAELTTRPTATGEEKFWAAATLVEAHVIGGDMAAARRALPAAREASEGDHARLSTAARSIHNVCLAKNLPVDWLRAISPPAVIHYAGHIIAAPGASGRFPATAEPAVAARIAELLAERNVGFGYGSLAAGADILFAEALLARGAQLHVLLPFRLDDFIRESVQSAGQQWIKRFKACLANAKSVRYATEDEYLGDDTLYVYCSRLGMGLAVLASQHLFAPIEQIVVWDRTPAAGTAGTAIDVEIWRETGRPQTVVPIPSKQGPRPGSQRPKSSSRTAPKSTSHPASNSRRSARAMLFGDLRGFSRLTDRELPIYVKEVLGAIERVRQARRKKVLLANTWGDGLFMVFQRANDAAECALALQAALSRLDLAALGLSVPLSLRIGGHLGPVYETLDPVLGHTNFFGAHVTRAAHIEPVTPPGCVYVTETFAAALALEHSQAFACDYVGMTKAAKGYGSLRMFLLRARRSASEQGSRFAIAV